jgi:hypothetical protein
MTDFEFNFNEDEHEVEAVLFQGPGEIVGQLTLPLPDAEDFAKALLEFTLDKAARREP